MQKETKQEQNRSKKSKVLTTTQEGAMWLSESTFKRRYAAVEDHHAWGSYLTRPDCIYCPKYSK